MSVLWRCPSYRESNKRSKERQGPTLGVCLIEISVLYYRESNKGSKERQGPTLGVCLIEISVLYYRESNKGSKERPGQIKGVKKGQDQLQVSILQRCPSYRVVH